MGNISILIRCVGQLCVVLWGALSRGAPEGKAYPDYICAMLTGDKSFLKRAEKDRLKSAGVMHFFAVSGFHLTVVAMVCFSLCRVVGFRPAAATFAMLLLCALYVWFTGAPVSASRALLMMAIYFGARWVFRKSDALAATVVTAWILLLWDPTQLFEPGFQLSFVVVTGIVTQATRMHAWLTVKEGGPPYELRQATPSTIEQVPEAIWKFIAGSFAVSWTAFWLSAPIVAAHFGVVPFASIALNTILVPLFALTMTTGFLSATLGLCGLLVVSEFLNHAAWILLSVIETAIGWTNQWFPAWQCEGSSLLAGVAVFLMLMIGLIWDLRRWSNRYWFAIVPLISLLSLLVSKWLSLT